MWAGTVTMKIRFKSKTGPDISRSNFTPDQIKCWGKRDPDRKNKQTSLPWQDHYQKGSVPEI